MKEIGMRMLGQQLAKRFPDLLFRRQFLLGPTAYRPNAAWKVHGFGGGLFLSAHRDVESSVLSSKGRTIGLVGYWVDPFRPMASSEEILKHLLDTSRSLDELLCNTYPLSGRWVLLYKEAQGCYVFTDPCGFRQVYFTQHGGGWCGSQPEIIRQVVELKQDNDRCLRSFLSSEGYRRQESAWVGSGTVYDRCFHLLPNHYLCLQQWESVRFYPRASLPELESTEVAAEASLILRNTIEAMSLRSTLMLPVTAGYDSRVLLAASRNVSKRVTYYIDRMGVYDVDHPDVAVSAALTRSLGLKFSVLDSADNVSFWFSWINRRSVTRARNLPKSRMIYAHHQRKTTAVNVNGNASKVCRNFFDKKHVLDQRALCAADLSRLLFHQELEYAVGALDAWRKDVGSALKFGYELLDMLYWEQRLGNWGSHFPAEQDIAIEEFSPFNNRRLLSLLLASPSCQRVAPDFELYRKMIQILWPEVLAAPFNPAHKAKPRGSGRFRSIMSLGRK